MVLGEATGKVWAVRIFSVACLFESLCTRPLQSGGKRSWSRDWLMGCRERKYLLWRAKRLGARGLRGLGESGSMTANGVGRGGRHAAWRAEKEWLNRVSRLEK